MTRLYDRAWECVIGPSAKMQATQAGQLAHTWGLDGIDVSNLDIAFRVTKTLKPEPNTCDLTIYNLSDASRKKMATGAGLTVRLSAGYVGTVSQIYLGEVRSSGSRRDGADILTVLSSGDSEKEIQAARLSLPMGPKVPAATVLRAIAASLRVDVGNVDAAAALLARGGVKTLHPRASALSGPTTKLLDDFCKSGDLEWSIQDGALQILARGGLLANGIFAVQLDDTTGLIGTPEIDASGVVTATALMIPDLRPGNKVSIKSLAVNGGFRIEHCEYAGSSFAPDWYVRFTAKAY